MSPVAAWLRLARPHVLLGGALLYGLGVAIAHYLLRPIDPARFWLGLGLVAALQLAGGLLHEHHASSPGPTRRGRTGFDVGDTTPRRDGLPGQAPFHGAAVCLALAASLATVGLTRQMIPPVGWILLLLGLLVAVFYSQPPLRLVHSGYGEISASVGMAGVVPAFAFSLQTGELHGLLFTASLPLVSLHFAMLLVLSLSDYAADRERGRRTLLVRLGWPSGLRLHDAAVGFAVLALVWGAVSGMPWRVALGVAIVLPLAAAQTVQLNRLRAGRPPAWGALTAGAVGLFGLSAYLLTAGFLLYA